MKKLELKNLKVKVISNEEKATIKGGSEQSLAFLSIGFKCSVRNSCARLGCEGPIAEL